MAVAAVVVIGTASLASAAEAIGDSSLESAISRHGNSDALVTFAQARNVTPLMSRAQAAPVSDRRRSGNSTRYVYDGGRRVGADPDPNVRAMILRDQETRSGGF